MEKRTGSASCGMPRPAKPQMFRTGDGWFAYNLPREPEPGVAAESERERSHYSESSYPNSLARR